MTNKSKRPNRQSIRLKGYDYSSPGYYFTTICVQDRRFLFGQIINGEMILNDAGVMIQKWYHKIAEKFDHITNDAFICMPNHIHFITHIPDPVGADPRVCPIIGNNFNSENSNTGRNVGLPQRTESSQQISIGTIIQWFKTMTTNEYIRNVKEQNWPRFNKRVWQRNYWEHIIRNENALIQIRKYIENNPLTWYQDRLQSVEIDEVQELSEIYQIKSWKVFT